MSRRHITRRTALAALASFAPLTGHGWAGCPMEDAFAIEKGGLPATSAALANHKLTILALGGAATLGRPAHGPEFTWPARLERRLSEAFPDVAVTVPVRAVARQPDEALVDTVEGILKDVTPALVIWGPGGTAAARGGDLDTFLGTINDVVDKVRTDGADMILMTLQYAPSVSRVVNLVPYRMAVLHGGDDAGVPVLDRYELMRYWSDSGFLDLDTTNADDRIKVSRTLYDCMAEILATAIVDATK
jgi:acyl-CoA thioesterase I